MVKIDLQQGSQEWLLWRSQGITSTDISVIMGSNPYKSKKDLILEKKGIKEVKKNEAMKRGSFFEKEALKLACCMIDVVFHSECHESPENSLFRASLDGIGFEDGKLVALEIKVPKEKGFLEAQKGHIPEMYLHQMNWHMMCSNAKKCVYFVFDPETKDSVMDLVFYDENLAKLMKEKALEFWEEYQNFEQKAYLDSFEHFQIHRKYVDLLNQKDSIENQIEEVKKLVLDYSGNKEFESDLLDCFFSSRSSYDYKAMKDDGIDIEKYKRQSQPFLTIKRK